MLQSLNLKILIFKYKEITFWLFATDKLMTPPKTLEYWIGLQNLRRHMCYRALKIKQLGSLRLLISVHSNTKSHNLNKSVIYICCYQSSRMELIICKEPLVCQILSQHKDRLFCKLNIYNNLSFRWMGKISRKPVTLFNQIAPW